MKMTKNQEHFTQKQTSTPVLVSLGAFVRLSSFHLLTAELNDLCFEPKHTEDRLRNSSKLHTLTF